MASAALWLGPWIPTGDGDKAAAELYRRHYSRRVYRDGREPALFVGPGEKLVLVTPARDALLVWRRFRSMDDQTGVNCAVFRNEGLELSSRLIRAAMAMAWSRWPGERLYTYVSGSRIRSSNPGYCFLRAGWTRIGRTKGGHGRERLWILEADPASDELGWTAPLEGLSPLEGLDEPDPGQVTMEELLELEEPEE